VTSLFVGFEAAMWVKLMNMTVSWFNTRKNEKITQSQKCLHISPSERWFMSGSHSLLRRADARGKADVIYCIWGILLFCGSGSDLRYKVGHIKII